MVTGWHQSSHPQFSSLPRLPRRMKLGREFPCFAGRLSKRGMPQQDTRSRHRTSRRWNCHVSKLNGGGKSSGYDRIVPLVGRYAVSGPNLPGERSDWLAVRRSRARPRECCDKWTGQAGGPRESRDRRSPISKFYTTPDAMPSLKRLMAAQRSWP